MAHDTKGSDITLKASDGHELAAYLAEPSGKARGGVVVIQEIFGVNSHIRRVVDQYAGAGYVSIAPALFDRIERGVTVPYTDMQKGFGYVQKMQESDTLKDLQAAIDRVKFAGKVAAVGYCWGGGMAFVAAAELPVQAAIAYYGGFIAKRLEIKPRVPVMFHFGERDTHIPLSDVEKIKAANPQQTFHLYAAEHGFNCDERASFDAPSAKVAFDRSIAFLHSHIG